MNIYILFAGPLCATSPIERALATVIRWASRGETVHLAVSDGHIVLEQTRTGPRLLSFETYVTHYPGLCAVVDVPAARARDLRPERYRVPRFRLSVLCWLTRGRVRSDDCVEMARQEIAAWCGFDVPRGVTTPHALLKHLISRGCHDEEIA